MITPQKLYLAPIKGITDSIYRKCFVKVFKGFDLAIIPFIGTQKGGTLKAGVLREVESENNKGLPIVPQLLSKCPEQFLSYGQVLYDLGYMTINWNLGCPSPMIINKKKGSGLLPFPDFIDSFLDKIFSRFPGNISIKMRLGMEKKEEIFDVLPVLNKYPVSEICIHPRTGKQLYKGDVDLDIFEKALSLTSHQVIYSGDIFTLEKFHLLSKRFKNLITWMIGRGAIKNPFLPSMIKGMQLPKPEQKNKMIKNFNDLLLEEYKIHYSGPSHILGKMKGIWFYMEEILTEKKNFLKKINKSRTIDNYMKVVDSFFLDIEN